MQNGGKAEEGQWEELSKFVIGLILFILIHLVNLCIPFCTYIQVYVTDKLELRMSIKKH